MAASEFAAKIVSRYFDMDGKNREELLVRAFDLELAEVREVLEGVIRVADRKTIEFDRARALYDRLLVKEG